MQGIVRELYVFRQRGQPGELVTKALFRRGIGMDGDRHAAGGERQTSLLAGETRDWMKEQPEPGLCFRRYKANIITEGIDVSAWKPGERWEAGEVLMEVSSSEKECFPECPYHEKRIECQLSSGAVFLKIIRGGIISLGDRIKKSDGLNHGSVSEKEEEQ